MFKIGQYVILNAAHSFVSPHPTNPAPCGQSAACVRGPRRVKLYLQTRPPVGPTGLPRPGLVYVPSTGALRSHMQSCFTAGSPLWRPTAQEQKQERNPFGARFEIFQ